jgi:hypothetical protein
VPDGKLSILQAVRCLRGLLRDRQKGLVDHNDSAVFSYLQFKSCAAAGANSGQYHATNGIASDAGFLRLGPFAMSLRRVVATLCLTAVRDIFREYQIMLNRGQCIACIRRAHCQI